MKTTKVQTTKVQTKRDGKENKKSIRSKTTKKTKKTKTKNTRTKKIKPNKRTTGGSSFLVKELANPPKQIQDYDDEPMFFNEVFTGSLRNIENTLALIGPYHRNNESMNMHSYGDIHDRVTAVNANIPIQFIYDNWKQNWNLKSPDYIRKKVVKLWNKKKHKGKKVANRKGNKSRRNI